MNNINRILNNILSPWKFKYSKTIKEYENYGGACFDVENNYKVYSKIITKSSGLKVEILKFVRSK